MKKHTILFLAANPSGAARLALDEEARAIQVELERSGFRDCFELVTRWAVRPLDLLRELRKLKPTVVHFSGHGGRDAANKDRSDQTLRRDIVSEPTSGSLQQHGLFFQRPDGRALVVSTAALEETFGAAGSSVKLVVLNACYSEVQAEALLTHVDCVVGMSGSIRDDAARSFAIGFYGGLGERESVAAAYKQGCAAIRLEGLPDSDRPQLKFRTGADASQLVVAAMGSVAAPAQAGSSGSPGRRLDDGVEARQRRAPERHHVFVGRATELAHIGAAFDRGGSGRVALVALQGMAGVGKTYLAHEFYARHPERFGSYQHVVIDDPQRPGTVAAWIGVLGEQAGIEAAPVNEQTIAKALRAQRALVHVDNVDSAAAAELVANLADALDGVPMLVTGRYGELGTAAESNWTRIELAPLDQGTSLALLQAELEGASFSVPEADLRELVRQVAGLPLALHLAAGYLRRGVTVDRFLERLRVQGLALGPRDPGDHVRRDRARGVLSTSFAISRELLLTEAGARTPAWSAALVVLGWAPRRGFGRSLGAAITGLDEASGAFEDFMDAAVALSLVRWLRPEERADAAWAVHPLLGEFLRTGTQRPEIDERIGGWMAKRLAAEPLKLGAELEAIGEWLDVDITDIFIRFVKRMHR